jgi:hypothetical protein
MPGQRQIARIIWRLKAFGFVTGNCFGDSLTLTVTAGNLTDLATLAAAWLESNRMLAVEGDRCWRFNKNNSERFLKIAPEALFTGMKI